MVSGSDGQPVQPAFEYLSRTYLKGRRKLRLVGSVNSVEAAVRDLCDFHDFLDAAQLSVSQVDEVALEDYLESMINVPSKSTGNPYSSRTIQRRRSTVWAFVTYCQDRGLLRHRFSTATVRTPRGSFETIAADISGPTVGPMDQHIRALHPQVVMALLDASGPALIDVAEDGNIVATGVLTRERLMPETCLQTGIRRAECCGLQRNLVMAANVEGRPPLSTVAIEVFGKGSKWRNVPFPVWLLQRLQAYVRDVRDPIVNEAIKNGWMKSDHGRLFVLNTDRSDAFGKPVLPAQFGREFAAVKARLLARLESSEKEQDQILAERVRRSRIVIHGLRHTFALTTYIRRRQAGDTDPSKYVQAVLGHVFRHTTEAMYLNASHIYECELSDEYTQMLKTALEKRSKKRCGNLDLETRSGMQAHA